MKRVVLLYGGRSSEHEVSCLSARSVLAAIDPRRYEVLPVGITREGRWTATKGMIEPPLGGRLPAVDDEGDTVALVGTRQGPELVRVDDEQGGASSLGPVDVAFPVLHGPWGEDGTVQGMLATVGVPYVGADVTASSIGVDKAATKATFAARGLPQGRYVAVESARWKQEPNDVVAQLREELPPPPWFTKPARQGSSIGIRKVLAVSALRDALAEAYRHDRVAVVEEGLESARELEVGVLGDEELEVTRPGEILTSHEFYDFEAKYLDTSELVIPARVPTSVAERTGSLAREAYRAIGCRGMARVDFFLEPDGRLLVNEINTIPGFTPASMFPRLWASEGMDHGALVDRLLTTATR